MKQKIFLLIISLLSLAHVQAQAQCAEPSNLQTSYSNNVTTFTWDAVPNAFAYTLEIKFVWDSWLGAQYGTTLSTNSLSLTGIYHSAMLDWRVKSECALGSSNFVESSVTIPCPEATNLFVSNITDNSATLNWSPATGYNTFVSDFVAAYRPLGSSNWISLGHTSDSSKIITGLNPNTTYEYCVNQSCVNFDSNPVFGQFTTTGCVASGNNADVWIDYFRLGSINRSSGAESNGYVNTGLSTTLSPGSTNNARFSARYLSNNNNPKKFAIYLDKNQNDNYADPGELIYGPKSFSTTGNVNFKVTIPSTLSNGTYGLRVIFYNQSQAVDPCSTGFAGEVEDYEVVIGSGNKLLDENLEQGIESLVEIYPNPSDGVFSVACADVQSYSVCDIQGAVLTQKSTKDQSFTVDLKTYGSGIYFLTIQHADGNTSIHKLNKQ
ncbi:MAG: GEVED domain-containing protein [Chitinophagaceae bacterium]